MYKDYNFINISDMIYPDIRILGVRAERIAPKSSYRNYSGDLFDPISGNILYQMEWDLGLFNDEYDTKIAHVLIEDILMDTSPDYAFALIESIRKLKDKIGTNVLFPFIHDDLSNIIRMYECDTPEDFFEMDGVVEIINDCICPRFKRYDPAIQNVIHLIQIIIIRIINEWYMDHGKIKDYDGPPCSIVNPYGISIFLNNMNELTNPLMVYDITD